MTIATSTRNAVRTYARTQAAAGLSAALLLIAAVGGLLLLAVARDTALADAANPYFIASDALRLYVAAPLIAMAACLALLAPGLIASYALARGRDEFGVWALKGFAISLLPLTLTPLLAHALGVSLAERGPALIALGALNVAALAALAYQERGGQISTATFANRAPDIALSLAAPVVTLLLLTPKFYWEDLNPDGAHLYFAVRNSVDTGSVFWPAGAPESLANFPTPNHMTQIPLSAWMMRIAGDSALALRLVFLLSLAPMAAGLMAAIRHNKDLPRPWLAAASVGAALIVYAVTLAFNTSYYPYFSDIAMPMAREPTIVAAFLGFAIASLTKNRPWTVAFAIFSYTAGPGGLAMMAFWSAALGLISLIEERKVSALRRGLIPLGIAIGVAASAALVEQAIHAANLAQFGSEFGAQSILNRLRFVSFHNFERIAYWAAPCGFAPAACLFWWRGQDRETRVFTVFTLVLVSFFFIQAYRVLPHHFAAAMALPLIVMWRLRWSPGPIMRRATALVVMAGLAAGLSLAIPPDVSPHIADSKFAASLAADPSIRTAPAPEDLNAFNDLTRAAFPVARADEDGATRRENVGLAWLALARENVKDPRYYFGRAEAPAGFTVIATTGGWTLSASDRNAHIQDRAEELSLERISPLYRAGPGGLFGPAAGECDPLVLDLKALLLGDSACPLQIPASNPAAQFPLPAADDKAGPKDQS